MIRTDETEEEMAARVANDFLNRLNNKTYSKAHLSLLHRNSGPRAERVSNFRIKTVLQSSVKIDSICIVDMKKFSLDIGMLNLDHKELMNVGLAIGLGKLLAENDIYGKKFF